MARSSEGQSKVRAWREHWQDEADAAYLYRTIAQVERDPQRARAFRALAEVEDKHAARWAELLREAGVDVPPYRPSGRARLLAWAGRLGPGFLVQSLLREEAREVKTYLMEAHRAPGEGAAGLARALARESAEHAGRLGELLGTDGEPWHRIASGGFLRNAVYGFNDGLTANFGLVMGVLGASVPPRVVLLSGIAGLIADALSMGSSGFLAAKSEQEVYAHEIAVEREEIRLMPDLEEEELALLYQSRGIGPEVARQLARDIMSRPDQALREKTHMELGIGELEISPLREGWITGLSTAVGAFIPVLPFLVLPGPVAAWTSFAISMLSHFAVGAARSVFTGRGPIRSGIDMFLVGLGVAVVGYMVGDRIAHVLAVGRAP
jgi:VIT1/CCC1 family predicted Fe2+/Mn2+ transporter